MKKQKNYKKQTVATNTREVQQEPDIRKKLTNTQIQIIFLFLLAILLYANTLTHKYALDDTLMITGNKFTKEGFSGIKSIMTKDAFVGLFGENKNLLPGGRYRPLSHVTFAIEYALFGLDPFIGHLVNVILYAFTCIFVFLVLKELFKNYQEKSWYLSFPFVIMALFIAHPLHTEVVANIKGRDEIMSLLGSFASLYFTIKFMKNRSYMNFALIFISFLFAILSKENAITFLGIIPLTIFFFYSEKLNDYFKKNTPNLAKYATICMPVFIATAIYFIIRYAALGFLFNNNVVEKELLNNPFVNATANEKYATILYTWGKYLKLLFIPHPLTHDYYPKQIPLIELFDIKAILPAIIYAAMAAYAIKIIWKKDIIAYGILFFLITFSIQSNLVFNIGAFMNERFMFISLLGFCIIVAHFLIIKLRDYIKKPETYRTTAVTILFIILGAYSVKTISRNPTWKDDFTLFTTDVKTSLNSAKCNVSAGGMLIEKAQKEKDKDEKNRLLNQAVTYLLKGSELHPTYLAGLILLGNAYLELENYSFAAYYYEKCLKMSPGYKDAMTNLLATAENASKTGHYNESINTYKILIKNKPQYFDYHCRLAEVYTKVNRVDTSITILNNVIISKSDFIPAYNKLAEIYGRILNNIPGSLDKSLEILLKAYSIDPKDASTLENLGIVYGVKKDYENSVKFFSKALEIKPDNAGVYNNLASTYKTMGQMAKAEECLNKAKELQVKKQ